MAFRLSYWLFLISSAAAAATGPYVRVEFELGSLSNANGLLQSGSKCSILGKSCSQKLTGYIDTNPSARGWPGSKPVDSWPQIISDKDNNIAIKKVISGDFCSGAYKEGILRIHVVDTGMKDRLIEDFECRSGITVANSESRASWSPEQTCEAKYNGKNNRLTFRVRAYAVPLDSCGLPPSRPKG
ncbi:uncharacterized protein LOC129587505 [Paramacrobiotus metropolitanus]|uniref:uncharacterized protein LOC129587505 n=1 Tax=Paramacrobiotus metropolitanus TaxID=2943436 RepID=UPI002445DF50|nr:uncharacterized protein LOC129587505 [Paramacrobiotus metropolitanus]